MNERKWKMKNERRSGEMKQVSLLVTKETAVKIARQTL